MRGLVPFGRPEIGMDPLRRSLAVVPSNPDAFQGWVTTLFSDPNSIHIVCEYLGGIDRARSAIRRILVVRGHLVFTSVPPIVDLF